MEREQQLSEVFLSQRLLLENLKFSKNQNNAFTKINKFDFPNNDTFSGERIPKPV